VGIWNKGFSLYIFFIIKGQGTQRKKNQPGGVSNHQMIMSGRNRHHNHSIISSIDPVDLSCFPFPFRAFRFKSYPRKKSKSQMSLFAPKEEARSLDDFSPKMLHVEKIHPKEAHTR
jgi:hypothetical protein